MITNIPKLPDVDFVETDPQATINNIIGTYEELTGEQLAKADPRRLFLLSVAYVIIQQRQQIDAAGKSTLLYYAKEGFLDHLGLMRQTPRLEAAGAFTDQRFTLSAPQASPIGIPQGTRVTADGTLFWRTIEPVTIAAGDTHVDVRVQAMTAGVGGNGLAIGEIDELVDPVPFVESTENLEVTQGGADRELDDEYRDRIYNAPAAFSIAGPAEAYEFWAYTASAAIVDVRATTPNPGEVEVFVLLDGGEIPDQPVLDAVLNVLSPDDVRPLTDYVMVSAPEPISYSVDFTYYIRTADSGSAPMIEARVQRAVADYVAWQRSKIGRDINPDELIARVKAAGAKRLDITSPAFDVLEQSQVAQEVSVSFVYGGTEDE